MKIGIIGAGHIGATAAKLFARAGHEVALSNSRGPETLADTIREIGEGAVAMTAEDAAAFGEVVLEAVPFGKYQELPAAALTDKVVISASNYYPERDGEIDFHILTQTELVAAHLEGSHVVKAFNTIYWEHLRDQGDVAKPLDERRAIFIAGDSAEAKAVVRELIEEIGFAAVDTGVLAESSVQEPGAVVYNRDLTAREARAVLGA
jgi:8-hydroxy-5-deazaflavin:NADPH oxidoreductase